MQAHRQPQPEASVLEAYAVVSATLDLPTLEERCLREIERGCLADPARARFSFELLRRATSKDRQQAREAWQRCSGEILRNWLHCHPRAEEACRVGSEEAYLTQTFECFWRTVADGQLQASTSLPLVLRYLRACLNAALLDALRAQGRPKGIPLQEPADSEGQLGGDHLGAHQLWERMQGLFADARERRVASLLYHCNLSPQEIFCLTPQEFKDVQEIRHLQGEILRCILRHSDLMS